MPGKQRISVVLEVKPLWELWGVHFWVLMAGRLCVECRSAIPREILSQAVDQLVQGAGLLETGEDVEAVQRKSRRWSTNFFSKYREYRCSSPAVSLEWLLNLARRWFLWPPISTEGSALLPRRKASVSQESKVCSNWWHFWSWWDSPQQVRTITQTKGYKR